MDPNLTFIEKRSTLNFIDYLSKNLEFLLASTLNTSVVCTPVCFRWYLPEHTVCFRRADINVRSPSFSSAAPLVRVSRYFATIYCRLADVPLARVFSCLSLRAETFLSEGECRESRSHRKSTSQRKRLLQSFRL